LRSAWDDAFARTSVDSSSLTGSRALLFSSSPGFMEGAFAAGALRLRICIEYGSIQSWGYARDQTSTHQLRGLPSVIGFPLTASLEQPSRPNQCGHCWLFTSELDFRAPYPATSVSGATRQFRGALLRCRSGFYARQCNLLSHVGCLLRGIPTTDDLLINVSSVNKRPCHDIPLFG